MSRWSGLPLWCADARLDKACCAGKLSVCQTRATQLSLDFSIQHFQYSLFLKHTHTQPLVGNALFQFIVKL